MDRGLADCQSMTPIACKYQLLLESEVAETGLVLTGLSLFGVWVLQPAVGVCHLDAMQLINHRLALNLRHAKAGSGHRSTAWLPSCTHGTDVVP